MHWFESMERDKVWNTQWRAANVSNNSNEDVENFDTQFQRMRYFVYTVGKNVNMIKSKNREQRRTQTMLGQQQTLADIELRSI